MTVQKLLVAVDLGGASQLVVDAAAGLAAALGAELALVHVWHAPRRSTGASGEALAAAVGADERSLQVLAGTAERRGVSRVTMQFLAGAPAEELTRLARGAYDLIVIGTHGRTGIRHVLMGSVAEQVVRAAPCPVLVVPLAER